MPDDAMFPPSHTFDPDDAGLQAQLEEFQQGIQSMQAEMEAELQQAQAAGEAEAERQAEEARAATQPDPAQIAKFEQMEAEYGSPILQTAAPGQVLGHSAREILGAAAGVAEKLLQQQGRPQKTAESRWYYAQGAERKGPVSQSELLTMLEDGDLSWTTLVWRKPMDGWKAASETELDELAGPGKPPPLPGIIPQ